MKASASTFRRLLIAVAAGSTVALGAAVAQTQAPAAPQEPTAATASAQPRLNIRQIYDRVEAAGYRDITEIELDDGRFEVKARDAQGARVKLIVNAGSGEIERSRR